MTFALAEYAMLILDGVDMLRDDDVMFADIVVISKSRVAFDVILYAMLVAYAI